MGEQLRDRPVQGVADRGERTGANRVRPFAAAVVYCEDGVLQDDPLPGRAVNENLRGLGRRPAAEKQEDRFNPGGRT